MNSKNHRERKSAWLKAEEFKALEKWIDKQPTLRDAQEALGISDNTLTVVRAKKGRGAPSTIAKIRAVLTPTNA